MPFMLNPTTGKLDYYVSGGTGPAGADGARGAPGMDGADGEDGQDGFPGVPGVAGAAGTNGLPGAPGAMGIGLPGTDGEDGNDGWSIPGPTGPQGPAGGGGGGAYTKFTKNLLDARSSGTFDITGLSGLTADKVVSIVQTADAIASKGNARDEPEMDMISLTGYVLNSTTIRAYWHAPSFVAGTYAFAYQVSG